MHEQAENQTEQTGLALGELLTEFRRARAEEPQFYYNELAERARATGRLRPVLENFLAERLSFADFKSAAAGESRQELGAARGRETGRYWRLNASGRLFLESFLQSRRACRAAQCCRTSAETGIVRPCFARPGGAAI
jgi:ectoine hydroxylase-related dioxygenase (phytanoyl-CoA dioxygenase family)